MQRKPSLPVANCGIKLPDNLQPVSVELLHEDDGDQQKRQQLINFGHAQWGFNNWNWTVTKQELDYVDFTNCKYTAGVVAYVLVSVKSFDIHRENIGYASTFGMSKGIAIHKARKCAVTNALRETLLSFGGSVSTELIELLEAHRSEAPDPVPEHNPPKTEPKNAPTPNRKEESTHPANSNMRSHQPPVKNVVPNVNVPPIAKAHPMPANLPPAANRPAIANAPRPVPPTITPHNRPNNVGYVLQPVMGGVQPIYAPPRLTPPHVAPPHLYPNYYEYAGPWHFTYETYDRHHGNLNLNFNIPPKNLVVNSRAGSVECKNTCVRPPGQEGEPLQYSPAQNQGCWIKPTIFYDGFWTEQKVKKWVAEQVEKQFPEDSSQKSTASSNSQPDPAPPKA